jgi:hypothetical protein
VTPGEGGPLRVALLHPADGAAPYVEELAAALCDAGHEVRPLLSRPAPGAEALLRLRGFAGPLTQVPSGLATALRGDFEVVHAFSVTDAQTALTWRRLTGGPAVFTAVEPLGRDQLADRRLRLWLVRRAIEDSDAMIAGNDEARSALQRWLAADAPVLAPGDASGHERLYRGLLARRG